MQGHAAGAGGQIKRRKMRALWTKCSMRPRIYVGHIMQEGECRVDRGEKRSMK